MMKILIVDDDPLIIYALSKVLSGFCDEIDSAVTGGEAISRIGDHSYNLYFLDVNLPDMSGIEVMEKIKEGDPETKIVVMTAGDVDDEMRKRIEGKAYQFIAKPFDLLQVKLIAKQAREEGTVGKLS